VHIDGNLDPLDFLPFVLYAVVIVLFHGC